MPVQDLHTDYLVVGAGATGMAFVDELLHRTKKDTTFIIVDRESRPGGHWVHAYPFVHLHQGSYFYGVNSEFLERDTTKTKLEFASKFEILSYYDRVMAKMIESGRVTFLSQCVYNGNGKVTSIVASDKEYHITTRCKVVDARSHGIAHGKVPSMAPPAFPVASGVNLIPINGIASLIHPYEEYTVIGAGKTGIDAVLYLLHQGVNPACIRWVISRDVWFNHREWFKPSKFLDYFVAICTTLAEEDNVDDVMLALEEKGVQSRIENSADSPLPEVHRCASITKEELEAVRGIGKFIRLGRVQRIEEDCIVLDRGEVSTGPNTLHIDCTRTTTHLDPTIPIFKDENTIVMQPLLCCQVVWSAAIIAMLEAKETDDNVRNRMARPVPNPHTPEEWIKCMLVTLKNLDALKPHQRDLDSMRTNALTNGVRYYEYLWKMITQISPILPKLLEKAETAINHQ